MCSQQTLHEVLGCLRARLRELLSEPLHDMILFGSYARNEASDDSDIDIMILSDLTRADISALQWKIGEVVSDILLDYAGMGIQPERELYYTRLGIVIRENL